MTEKEQKQEHFVSMGIIPGSERHYTHRYGRWWDADKPWMDMVEKAIFLLVLGIVVALIALVMHVLNAIV